MMQPNNELPKTITAAELFADNPNAWGLESLNALLNADPNPKWILEHPFIKDYMYIPIDKIEFMLRKIFKKYSIQITGQGTAFNGVWVTVRVNYLNPITNTMEYHDGIGAKQLQTKKGTSPADMVNINNGAIDMAFPIAKTVAIKDACDHFGRIFGCDLNRKNTMKFEADQKLNHEDQFDQLTELYDLKKELIPPAEQINFDRIISTKEKRSFVKAINILKQL